MVSGIVQYQHLMWLHVVQVVLDKLQNVSAAEFTDNYFCCLKASYWNCC